MTDLKQQIKDYCKENFGFHVTTLKHLGRTHFIPVNQQFFTRNQVVELEQKFGGRWDIAYGVYSYYNQCTETYEGDLWREMVYRMND